MTHIEDSYGASRSGLGLASVIGALPPDPPDSLVHVVDFDDAVQRPLCGWLAAAGIGSRTYSSLGALLNARDVDLPGCVVIDAELWSVSGLELGAILQPLGIRHPIVVTAYHAEVAVAVRAMKTGAIDFVEKPLREPEILKAVQAAIEVDCEQRRAAARKAQVQARFATLSPREKQVMGLVTAGKLNKQVAGDLGLSEITVKAHRGAAVRKMGARSLADLVRMADVIEADLKSEVAA
jgi:FixJ family two-component response regulator